MRKQGLFATAATVAAALCLGTTLSTTPASAQSRPADNQAAPMNQQAPMNNQAALRNNQQAPMNNQMGTRNNQQAPMNNQARTSNQGAKGDPNVTNLQNALNKNGANIKVDGKMGPQTREAIRRYQQNNNLTATGSADSATRAKLGV
jgi:hypothetical protein